MTKYGNENSKNNINPQDIWKLVDPKYSDEVLQAVIAELILHKYGGDLTHKKSMFDRAKRILFTEKYTVKRRGTDDSERLMKAFYFTQNEELTEWEASTEIAHCNSIP